MLELRITLLTSIQMKSGVSFCRGSLVSAGAASPLAALDFDFDLSVDLFLESPAPNFRNATVQTVVPV
jgi:hypothetical protein